MHLIDPAVCGGVIDGGRLARHRLAQIMAGAAGEPDPGSLRLSRAGSLSRPEARWSVVRSGIKPGEDLLPEGNNLSVGAKKQVSHRTTVLERRRAHVTHMCR